MSGPDEVNLATNKSGSARRARSARKLAMARLERVRKRPKWRRQLSWVKGRRPEKQR